MQSKMSLWLEVVSAAAVVISLVFVGLEIRNGTEQNEQTTRALNVAAYQDLINRIVDMNAIDIAEGNNVEEILALESPSAEQLHKLRSRLWIIFRHGDMAYFQYESGSINEERMLSAMAPFLLRLNDEKVRVRWNAVKSAFVPSFQSYVDEYINDNLLSDTGE